MLQARRLPWFGWSSSALVSLVSALACSAADGSPVDSEPVGEAAEAIGVAVANGCAVFWDKINYDTPANGDVGEFIELRVEKTSTSTATTLGQCGLGGIVLINGANCQPYLTIPLLNVPIPNDGRVQICDQAWNSACDVDVNPTQFGWLQNDAEAIVFMSANGTPNVHGSWEGLNGAKVCLPGADAGLLASVVVPTENSNNPDQTSVWCSGGFQLRPTSSAGLGMAYSCVQDGGVDASPEAGTDSGGPPDSGPDASTGGAAGTGGSSTGGSGGTSTGGAAGTGGSSTGGSGGGSTGGSGGSSTGGAAGTGGSTGGAGGTSSGGSGGSATGGGAGAPAGGAGGSAAGGSAGSGASGSGATTGGGGSGATGTGGSATGGAAGAAGSGLGPVDPGDDGGCGCELPGRSPSGSAGWLALLGAAWAFTRRRRG